jgi:hypothetical protein
MATDVHLEPLARRTVPLALRVGQRDVILFPAEVNLLVDGLDKYATGMTKPVAGENTPATTETLQQELTALAALAKELTESSPRITDPPMEINRERTRLLRRVIVDITGYQRGELPLGLYELRQALKDGIASPDPG